VHEVVQIDSVTYSLLENIVLEKKSHTNEIYAQRTVGVTASAEDAYSSMAPDPTFAVVGGPS
jgi:hypothetical protein